MKSIKQNKNLPFIYYRLPNEKNVWFIQSKSNPKEIDSLNNVPDKPGFILYPFAPNSSSKPCFILGSKQILSGNETLELWNNYKPSTQYPILNTKTKEEYCKNVTDAIKEIKSGELQKVVLSRIKTIEGITINPLTIFHKLCNKYPTAFVSLVYIPGELLWITATPELLISAENNKIKTVSLAGTKPADSMEDPIAIGWGEKERIEQQIVTDYINEILKKYCTHINISGPDEIIAGNVKHLKSEFTATLKTDLWSLISALHPTPAVCGIPLNKAKAFIEETEGYDRKYYTGFLGPCNMDGKTDLFVNLRCAGLYANSVHLYVGGGITKDSVPEKEWEETELKSKTLLFAFEENKE